VYAKSTFDEWSAQGMISVYKCIMRVSKSALSNSLNKFEKTTHLTLTWNICKPRQKSCLKLKTLRHPLPGLNTYQNTVHDLGKHTTSDLNLGSEALVKHNLVYAIWYSSMRNFTDMFLFVRTGPGLILRKLLQGKYDDVCFYTASSCQG